MLQWFLFVFFHVWEIAAITLFIQCIQVCFALRGALDFQRIHRIPQRFTTLYHFHFQLCKKTPCTFLLFLFFSFFSCPPTFVLRLPLLVCSLLFPNNLFSYTAYTVILYAAMVSFCFFPRGKLQPSPWFPTSTPNTTKVHNSLPFVFFNAWKSLACTFLLFLFFYFFSLPPTFVMHLPLFVLSLLFPDLLFILCDLHNHFTCCNCFSLFSFPCYSRAFALRILHRIQPR